MNEESKLQIGQMAQLQEYPQGPKFIVVDPIAYIRVLRIGATVTEMIAVSLLEPVQPKWT